VNEFDIYVIRLPTARPSSGVARGFMGANMSLQAAISQARMLRERGIVGFPVSISYRDHRASEEEARAAALEFFVCAGINGQLHTLPRLSTIEMYAFGVEDEATPLGMVVIGVDATSLALRDHGYEHPMEPTGE